MTTRTAKPESALEFPFQDSPGEAELRAVADGIFWLRMKLPFALDHVNLWLLEDKTGWTLVDTGFGNDATKTVWQHLFDNGLTGRPIIRLIATHFHPDHIGLAGWLNEQIPGLGLITTRTEWLQARMLGMDTSDHFAQEHVTFYRRAGADPDFLDAIAKRGNIYSRRVTPIPPTFTRIGGGDVLTIGGREWRILIGGGHSPEHACLYCESDNILIAGDQVLPEISPNVSIWPIEPSSDPLADFIATLNDFRSALPGDALVLPSHGRPFYGLHERIDMLLGHHEERLDRAEEALQGTGGTVFDVTSALFKRDLDMHQRVFAIGEALAHLNHLVSRGRVTQEEDETGVLRFRPEA